MASGKSLELAKIGRTGASPICKCGAPFNDHLRRDGELLVRFNNPNHEPRTGSYALGTNRAMRRAARKHGYGRS